MSKILLIDDLRSFKAHLQSDDFGTDIARNYQEGLVFLEAGDPYTQIWLDHDLGIVDGVLNEIKPCVKYLVELAEAGKPYPVETIIVHTSNSVEAESMLAKLTKAGYKVERVDAKHYFTVASAY